MNSFDVGNQSTERLHNFPKATQWMPEPSLQTQAMATSCGSCFPLCEKPRWEIWNVKARLMVKMFIEEAGGEMSGHLGFNYPSILPGLRR